MTEGDSQVVAELVLVLREITVKVRDLAVKGDDREGLEERAALAAALAKELARVLGVEQPELTAIEAAESAAIRAILRARKK